MNKWFCLMLVSGLLSLSGCIKLFPEPSEGVQTVKLGGMSIQLIAHKKSKHSIVIGEVSGRDHLQSSRIVVEKQDKGLKTLDYLARVEWEDSLSKVVQRDFRNTLSSVFKSVTLENDNLKTDYMVQCDIESFNVEQKEGHFSNVSL
ncbi:MAG: ABC-type transport auxiliary lipoprotein family protein, partial [Candidatus Nucleicultricaceae bacterium]